MNKNDYEWIPCDPFSWNVKYELGNLGTAEGFDALQRLAAVSIELPLLRSTASVDVLDNAKFFGSLPVIQIH